MGSRELPTVGSTPKHILERDKTPDHVHGPQQEPNKGYHEGQRKRLLQRLFEQRRQGQYRNALIDQLRRFLERRLATYGAFF